MRYRVLYKLENGELLELADLDDLIQAKRLLESFKEHWPGDYSIQDSASGADIALDE